MTVPHQSPTPRRSSSFTPHRHADVTVVAVEGDLDLVSAPGLKETITGLLGEGERRLVLDFSGVPFMDSTALSVLVAVQRRLGPDERMVIAAANPEVLRVFDLSGLTASFRIFPALDAGVQYARNAGTGEPSPVPPLTADAALMVGIASTAMPFAQSPEDEVERWLRVLRRHGEAGAVLTSLGVSEAAIRRVEPHAGHERRQPGETDRLTAVTEDASRIALQRGAAKVSTTDVLLAAMHVYGATFDRVLAAHGGDIDELAARVAVAHPAAA